MFATARGCSMSDTWCSQSKQHFTPLYSPQPSSQLKSPSFIGPTATQFLEWITPSGLASLAPYTSTLSVLLNETGGIIDDTVITKHASDAFYVVTNAGRRERDLAWLKEKVEEWNKTDLAKKEGGVEHEVLEDWGLLALQGTSALLLACLAPVLTRGMVIGPEAAQFLQTYTAYDLKELTFGKSAYVPIEGYKLHVARGGYTGEDGFEVCSYLHFL